MSSLELWGWSLLSSQLRSILPIHLAFPTCDLIANYWVPLWIASSTPPSNNNWHNQHSIQCYFIWMSWPHWLCMSNIHLVRYHCPPHALDTITTRNILLEQGALFEHNFLFNTRAYQDDVSINCHCMTTPFYHMLYNQTDVKQLQVGSHYLPFHLLHVLWHNFYFTNANNNCFQEINPSKPIDKETIMQTARRALHLMFNSWIHFIFSFPLFLSCLPFFFFWLFHTFPAQLPTSLLSSPTTFYWFEVQFLFDIVFELHFLSALTTQHLAPTVSTTKSFPYLLIRLSPFPIFYFIPFSLLLHTHLTQKLKQKFVQITENIFPSLINPERRDSYNTH